METSTKAPATRKNPTHLAYRIRENATGEPFWTRTGCAWPHNDGEGSQIQLETMPLNGRVTLRVASKVSN